MVRDKGTKLRQAPWHKELEDQRKEIAELKNQVKSLNDTVLF